ncbi:MAG: hypothetical protein NXY57DRAFT_1041705 [Lentinula lateritia]|uniref:J domain-containing protein n=1 Tax=Lentinula lateritia TaxID=40482 RepID=A0ABQ8V8M9_9AGAR|nr:MAG: hypothetical protein NXY57DRAFT_1041705 [Lentinula lateritia]KAJ4471185.1 hypothetical protein C8R41DRAFT_870634 [Lentinula lateritia]
MSRNLLFIEHMPYHRAEHRSSTSSSGPKAITATPDDPRNKTPRRRKPSDPHASEHFQSISTAYQTLSVPALRSKYNEFGIREGATESVFVDPEEVFSKIFGGERSFGEAALQEVEEEAEREGGREEGQGKEMRYGAVITTEDKAKKEEERNRKCRARTERVTQLSANLKRKLGIFTESATGIDDVGVNVYSALTSPKNPTALNYDKPLPSTTSPKRTHSSQSTNPPSVSVAGYIAYKANIRFQLNSVRCRKSGSLSHAERQKLEEQATEKGLQALFKGAKLAVDSVTSGTPDVNSSKHSTNSSSSSSGLGIGTGLGNLDRDIGSGLGGMFGFRTNFF